MNDVELVDVLLRDARVIDLQPDEVLVVIAPGVVTSQHADLVKRRFAVHTHRPVLVIGRTAGLFAIATLRSV